jgi:hypothetical protein
MAKRENFAIVLSVNAQTKAGDPKKPDNKHTFDRSCFVGVVKDGLIHEGTCSHRERSRKVRQVGEQKVWYDCVSRSPLQLTMHYRCQVQAAVQGDAIVESQHRTLSCETLHTISLVVSNVWWCGHVS